MPEELPRRVFLQNLPIVHENDPRAHLTGKAHLMRDDKHRHAAVGKLLHNGQHLADHLRIECARRLVEEHHLRVHRQRADDRDTLLLPAGKLGGIRIGLVPQSDAVKQLKGLFIGLLLAHELELNWSERNIFQDCQVIKKVKLLKHHAHLLADFIKLHLRISDELIFKPDFPFRRLF